MSLEAMLESLSTDEKLALMERLWRDVTSDADRFPSPDWHAAVIEHRLHHPLLEPSISLTDAMAEVRERLDARRTAG